jgi:nitrogen fixation NifU-like protein
MLFVAELESPAMYSKILLDHFENPRNSGDLPTANIRVRVENPVCADVLELALRAKDGIIEEIRFKAHGCVPSVACASKLTELVRGAELESLQLQAEELIEALGGVPEASFHAAQLSVEALKIAMREAARLGESAAQHG